MIEGQPYAIARILHLTDGETNKQETCFQVPEKKVYVIESVGVNAFLQPGQSLLVFVEPFLNGGAYVFPIVLPGESFISAPEFPYRKFGSQGLLLYADTRVDVGASRSGINGKAQVEVNISGRLVDSL